MSNPYTHPDGSHHVHIHQQHVPPQQPQQQPEHQIQHQQPLQLQQPGQQDMYHHYVPPPSNVYYGGDFPPDQQSTQMAQGYSEATAPPPPMSISLPPPQLQPSLPYNHPQTSIPLVSPYEHPAGQMLPSPYDNPTGMPLGSGTPGSGHYDGMPDYFAGYNQQQQQLSHQNSPQGQSQPGMPVPPLPPQLTPLEGPPGGWESHAPHPARGSRKNNLPGGPGSYKAGAAASQMTKTTRQQFTACGACRHRRVKCDLKDRQEDAERLALEQSDGAGPQRGKVKMVACSNCAERGLNCIDEFAPIKAAKQLRRGKRISEIEVIYGKNVTNAAVVHQPPTDGQAPQQPETHSNSISPLHSSGHRPSYRIPELTKAFFDSAFFRRFQVQRPVIDPGNLIRRYLSQASPTAAAMGPQGAILCHVLYAWAVSYGVDENGELDVPEGGTAPLEGVSVHGPGEGEVQREEERLRRKENMREVITVILKEIDDHGVMRKPTWDGVRVLLMVLPLTEGISTPVERLAMYDTAISQVFTLCSFTAMGYDGQPSGTASVNGGTDDDQDLVLVRVRVYWYAFVHEGITTGLKGGRLHLDDEDLETIQDSIEHRALVRDSAAFRISSKFATAPINLALACRKINKALTGPAAKRRTAVNGDHLKQAWEALEKCWEEFDELLALGSTFGDETVRFADGWKIFLFEAQNVIRTNLEARFQKLLKAAPTAHITQSENTSPSSSNSPEALHADLRTIQHLLEISRDKCDVKTRQILEMVKRHVGTRFFEWDASLVRDGTYYAATLLAREGGSDEDVAVCIQALSELRWAHAKGWERSQDLRREWRERSPMPIPHGQTQTWESVIADLAKLGSDVQSGGKPTLGLGVSDGSVTSGSSSSQQHQHHHQHQDQHHQHQHQQQHQQRPRQQHQPNAALWHQHQPQPQPQQQQPPQVFHQQQLTEQTPVQQQMPSLPHVQHHPHHLHPHHPPHPPPHHSHEVPQMVSHPQPHIQHILYPEHPSAAPPSAGPGNQSSSTGSPFTSPAIISPTFNPLGMDVALMRAYNTPAIDGGYPMPPGSDLGGSGQGQQTGYMVTHMEIPGYEGKVKMEDMSGNGDGGGMGGGGGGTDGGEVGFVAYGSGYMSSVQEQQGFQTQYTEQHAQYSFGYAAGEQQAPQQYSHPSHGQHHPQHEATHPPSYQHLQQHHPQHSGLGPTPLQVPSQGHMPMQGQEGGGGQPMQGQLVMQPDGSHVFVPYQG